MLLGLIFFVPLGSRGGDRGPLGLLGQLRDRRGLHKQGQREVTEGTSALFLLESGAVVDRIHDEVKGMDFEIISTNLPKDQEEKLREAFAA